MASSNASEDTLYEKEGERLPDPQDPAEELALYTAVGLMTVIIVVGCAGNILAILAVRLAKKLQTVSNIFVVNLSVCDLLFVTFVLPFNIYTYITDDWKLNTNLCKFVGFLGYTLTGTTIITITMIAWNRYKLVTDLAAYKKIFIPCNIAAMLVVAWGFPVLCLLPSLTEVWGRFGYVAMMVTCNLVLDHSSQSFKLFLLIVRALIPSLLIIYYYSMIYRTTKASHRRISRQSIMTLLDYHNNRKEMHLTRMMTMIFVVFVLSYFPCTVTGIIDWNTVLSKQFHMFCQITVYLGSAVNPCIYGLMNSQFRNAYLSMLRCKAVRKDQALLEKMAVPREAHLYEINEFLSGQPSKDQNENTSSGLLSTPASDDSVQTPGMDRKATTALLED